MPDPDVALMQHLHDEHGAALWRFCRRLVPDDRGRAEDVVQETLLRAWRHRTILEARARGARVAVQGRPQHRDRPVAQPADEPRDAGRRGAREGVGDETDQLLLSWVVAEALTQLSPEHRAVLLECYYRGRPVAEAATRLGVPEGTVKSRTHYALRALKLALEEMGVGA